MISLIKRLFKKQERDYNIILGQLLKEKGLITHEQLQKTLKIQRERFLEQGKVFRVGQIIVELGFISEENLLRAINDHYNISTNSLTKDNIRKLVNEKRIFFLKKAGSPKIPIWLKLSLASIIVIIPTVISGSYIMLTREKARLYNHAIEISKINLQHLAKSCSIPLHQNKIHLLNSLAKETFSIKGLLHVSIVDKNNIIKGHSSPKEAEKLFIKYDGYTPFSYSVNLKGDILNMSLPVLFKNRYIGNVHICLSTHRLEVMNHAEKKSVFLLGMLAIFTGIILSVLMGIRFSRPISKLVEATEKISEGNYKLQIDLNRKDEFGNLARAFNRMSDDLRKKELMQKSFGKYVGPEVLEMILANPGTSWLKGCKNEATIIFVDIRGFTSYAAARKTEKIVEGVNKFLEIVSTVIRNHEGYIDKFIGDAVLAVFGVPVFHKDHLQRAVTAAVNIQKKLIKASRIKKEYELLASVGIGMDTGIVISGNIGSQIKMEYTVIGDCVNHASHLNGLAGPGEIVVSKKIKEQLPNNLTAKALPPMKIKGKSAGVETFRIHEI